MIAKIICPCCGQEISLSVEGNKKKQNPVERKRFVPPTVDEVKTYCDSVGSKVDPETFVNYYDSVGWMIGKKKMNSWKSAIVTWEKRSGLKRSVKVSSTPNNPEEEVTMTDDEWIEMMRRSE